MQLNDDKNIHPLWPVFQEALSQVTQGKGEERHGHGNDFLEQPWLHYARVHGEGFLTGQAAKKLEEAVMNRNTLTHEQWIKEMTGVLVYVGMAILYKEMRKIAVDQITQTSATFDGLQWGVSSLEQVFHPVTEGKDVNVKHFPSPTPQVDRSGAQAGSNGEVYRREPMKVDRSLDRSPQATIRPL